MINDRFRRFNSGRVNFFLLATITVILFAAVLKITSSVVLPFTISMLLAIITSPLVKFLEKFRLPRIVSVLLVLFLFVGILAIMVVIVSSSGRSLLALYPRYEARITEIYIWVARLFELPYDEHLSIFDNIWGQVGVRNRVRIMTLSFSNGFIFFLRDAFLVILYMIFLLVEAASFKRKLQRAFEGERAERIIKISSDLMTQVTHYLSIKFIISLATGLIVGVSLRIVGVEFAILWGLLQFILNFIPNIGSIAVGMAATAFSLIQFWPNPMPVLATGIIMITTNMVIGSIVEPKIMGDRLGLSPLIILVSLLIWGWIWGFAGLILAVPMMAIIKIVCENIPMLEPISVLLGSGRALKAVMNEDSREETGTGE